MAKASLPMWGARAPEQNDNKITRHICLAPCLCVVFLPFFICFFCSLCCLNNASPLVLFILAHRRAQVPRSSRDSFCVLAEFRRPVCSSSCGSLEGGQGKSQRRRVAAAGGVRPARLSAVSLLHREVRNMEKKKPIPAVSACFFLSLSRANKERKQSEQRTTRRAHTHTHTSSPFLKFRERERKRENRRKKPKTQQAP